MNARSTLLLVTLFAGAAAGCHDVTPPIEGRSDPYRSPQVEFADSDVKNETAVGEIKLTRDNADLLFVSVPLRATSDRSFYVDYRVTFFDANGHPMSSTGWAQHYLTGNTYEYVTANSLTPGAKDFQMDIRYAK